MSQEEDYTQAQRLRMKAEEKLKNKKLNTDSTHTDQDAQRLLHELQVHQIEL
jgi:hypothetical protein